MNACLCPHKIDVDMLPPLSAKQPPRLTESSLASDSLCWYLVQSKPRQEATALINLERQGYECYLPRALSQRQGRRGSSQIYEPIFAGYLFIRLDSSQQGKSWSPIQFTTGVNRLVKFGSRAAKIEDSVIRLIQSRELSMPSEHGFEHGECVVISSGPFAGIEAIYQTSDAQKRSLVLLEILSKTVSMQINTRDLRKAS